MFPSIWTPPAPPKPLPYPAHAMPAATISRRSTFRPKAGTPNPAEIEPSSLKGQFMADIATMYQNTAGTTPVTTDGDSCRHWANQKETAYPIKELSYPPTFRENIFNGYPALEFGATDLTRLESSTLGSFYDPTSGPQTIAIAFKLDNASNDKTLFCISSGGDASCSILQSVPSVSAYQAFKSDNTNTDNARGGTPDTAANWLVLTDDGTEANAWLNGTQIITAESLSVPGSTGSAFWVVGALVRTSIIQSVIGKIGEVWWWNTELTVEQVEDTINPYGIEKFL